MYLCCWCQATNTSHSCTVVYVTEPEELLLVEAFLNTRDHEDGADVLDNPAGLEAWLRSRNLLVGARVPGTEWAAARELREAIRETLTSGALRPVSARLAAACRRYLLRMGDPVAGEPALVPEGKGVQAAVGWVVADLARSQILGTWKRLKICPSQGCGWVFIDNSKNGSRRWCEMSSCGNQHKVRAYRAKRRSTSARPGEGQVRVPAG